MTATRDQEAAAIEQAAAQIIAAAGRGLSSHLRAPAERARRRPPGRRQYPGRGSPRRSAPLIVVGRSGHAAHHVLGSVPVRLLHHSPYPVLTIP